MQPPARRLAGLTRGALGAPVRKPIVGLLSPLLACVAQLGAQTITVLPPLPGSRACTASDLSADGSRVVGYCAYFVAPERSYVVRGTNGEIETLGAFGGRTVSYGDAISGDGATLAGSGIAGGLSRPFIWEASFAALPMIAGYDDADVADLSLDGRTVAGTLYSRTTQLSRAVLWRDGAVLDLGVLPGMTSSAANAMSADGSVVVGTSSRSTLTTPPVTSNRAFRWTEAGGMVDLGLLPGTAHSAATAVSADGDAVVGLCRTSGVSTYRAFRWTASGGVERLAVPSGATWTSAQAVSPDGSVVFGMASFAPYVWLPEGPVESLDWLISLGVDLTGWEIGACIAVSVDSSALLCQCTRAGHGHWVVISGLPPLIGACRPDCDGDGDLTFFDFLCFQNAFLAGCP